MMTPVEYLHKIFTNELGNGLRIRHQATNGGNWWYAIFSPATGKIHDDGGGSHRSLSGFAEAHHKSNIIQEQAGRRVKYAANGWTDCEYEPVAGSNEFITTKNCRAGLVAE
tara:strand:- start:970 stop:1302 length:333 start_codon:yes stop_codon:yes gene_type:complete